MNSASPRKNVARRRMVAGASAAMLGVIVAGSSGGQTASATKVLAVEGQVRYVGPVTRAAPSTLAVRAKPDLQRAADTALQLYAPHFGVTDAATQLQKLTSHSLGARGDIVRYRQLHRGIPVIGGELVMALNGAGQLSSLSGEVNPQLQIDRITPSVSAAQARQTAAVAVAKYHGAPIASLSASEPELSIYDAGLIGPANGAPARLVWRMEITSLAAPVRQLVLIDALNRGVALHFNQIETARNRETYTANNGAAPPWTLLCNESQPLCTNGANADADAAHRYAGDTYDFYQTRHGRDSYDGFGAALRSIVHLNDANVCPNAYWDGARLEMVYCAGAPQADDVVAHELTHAVTNSSSNLFYYYQSGAINESLSDVWGEFVDLTNGRGNDASSMRWRMGEDWAALGVIRNMANPPEFAHPDRMRSPYYWPFESDNGGVHLNSGVNNKAATLMVDGGTFNGYSVNGIGMSKTAALYYRVQTQHLTSGSDYADLYLALRQACQNMIGSNDITASDCVQVANALDAVEMRMQPAMDENAEAPVCGPNQLPTNTYYESFEALDPTRWSTTSTVGSGEWDYWLYATAGRIAAGTWGWIDRSDYTFTMTDQVAVPANAFLHFRHSFDQDATFTSPSTYYDGGVLEYSANNGASWTDAGALHNAGTGYEGVLAGDNPLAGRPAFVGVSNGYVSSRYDLSSLAGQSVRIRFRNTSDSILWTGRGWYIDEVRIYTCSADPSPNSAPTAHAGEDQTVSPLRQVTLDGSGSRDADGSVAEWEWEQVSGPQVGAQHIGRSLSFVSPATPTQEALVFRLSVTDDRGATASDETTVRVVNQQPTASAGEDRATQPRIPIDLLGSGTDADGSIASYFWTQTAGARVDLSNPAGPATSFYAPSVPGSEVLTFRFSARDNFGGEATDEVSVTVTNPPPVASAGADRSTSAGLIVTLNGSGSDANGSITAYRWEQIAGPSVSFPSAVAQTSFSAPALSSPATLTFRLTVTDSDGGTHADEVNVNVQAQPTGGGGGGGAMSWGVLLGLGLLSLRALRRDQR